MKIRHEFVGYIPERLDEGTLYISILYGTVVHRCACGCGEEVVTPLGPADWRFTYDGETVSLHPSVGNWSFDCRSHYWISGGEVQWARAHSREEVFEARKWTKQRRARVYSNRTGQLRSSAMRPTGGNSRFAEMVSKLRKLLHKRQ